jgi:hypothetical protein
LPASITTPLVEIDPMSIPKYASSFLLMPIKSSIHTQKVCPVTPSPKLPFLKISNVSLGNPNAALPACHKTPQAWS